MYQIFLPHPNPPLGKGRELDFQSPPNPSGGLRGVILITANHFSNNLLATTVIFN
jgi:hypothetical protein